MSRLNYACVINFRDDDSEVLRRALSGEIRRTRRQRIKVSIHMTFCSWVLELILGNFLLALIFGDLEGIGRWYRTLDQCVLFILLPCTYIINTDKTKEIIVSQNWCQGIRSIFLHSIQVAPVIGPDPPPQPRNASASARNVAVNQ